MKGICASTKRLQDPTTSTLVKSRQTLKEERHCNIKNQHYYSFSCCCTGCSRVSTDSGSFCKWSQDVVVACSEVLSSSGDIRTRFMVLGSGWATTADLYNVCVFNNAIHKSHPIHSPAIDTRNQTHITKVHAKFLIVGSKIKYNKTIKPWRS
jgi:hypothetical protein